MALASSELPKQPALHRSEAEVIAGRGRGASSSCDSIQWTLLALEGVEQQAGAFPPVPNPASFHWRQISVVRRPADQAAPQGWPRCASSTVAR